ncbi:ABC transporter ATP-binding protein [Acidiferrobacter sp. SPIII_3]|uniref:ABC transporter ATP-binding protein n=1 Tax=Acidiferrobacter sp. SPIII_3 TaxID=1281578 RepID=UPI001F0C8D21|nr:ABC transporter ATP-binding protein [Acidiferrobacter sp. SPIII_3]
MDRPTSTEPLVTVRDLAFYRDDRPIFEGLNLTVAKGGVTAIMGGSGAGKTTLLSLIGGRLLPARGTVTVAGEVVGTLSRKALFALRRRMGMLFQSSALLTDLDVYENVAFPMREHTRLPETLIHDLVLMKLEMVGLRGARKLFPAELSGGMSRRVALARAIALDPMMVMYDEPFTGLDPISMGVIVKLIRELNDALGMTSIIVTHDVVEACTIADYIYLLGEGRVIAEGTPADMKKTDAPEVRQFMGGLPDGPVAFHYPASRYLDDLLMADRS